MPQDNPVSDWEGLTEALRAVNNYDKARQLGYRSVADERREREIRDANDGIKVDREWYNHVNYGSPLYGPSSDDPDG